MTVAKPSPTQIAQRPCVALAGGPRDGWWWFAPDWQRLRESATNMGRTIADVEGWPLGYVETAASSTNPVGYIGRVWTWKP